MALTRPPHINETGYPDRRFETPDDEVRCVQAQLATRIRDACGHLRHVDEWLGNERHGYKSTGEASALVMPPEAEMTEDQSDP